VTDEPDAATFSGWVISTDGDSMSDDRFGWIGDATSGTLLCQWPGCESPDVYVADAGRVDDVADEHWHTHVE